MDKKKLDFINLIRRHWLLRNIVRSSEVLDFIACQFALESNFGTSSLALTQHNFCGMKIPYKRCFFGYRISNDSEFAAYDSLDSCVIDYVAWLFYQRPSTNQLLYLSNFKVFLLNSGYCPELGYLDRIFNIYNQLNS